jgi:hypothetical protein
VVAGRFVELAVGSSLAVELAAGSSLAAELAADKFVAPERKLFSLKNNLFLEIKIQLHKELA